MLNVIDENNNEVMFLFHNHQVQQQEMVYDVYYQAMEEMNQDNVEYQ